MDSSNSNKEGHADFDAKYENDFNHKIDPQFKKIHFAAKINDLKMAEILFSEGSEINAIDIIYLIEMI